MDNDVLVQEEGRLIIGGPRKTFTAPDPLPGFLLESAAWQNMPKTRESATAYRGWCRRADRPEWHSVRFRQGEMVYRPICKESPWQHGPGDVTLDILPATPFGPVCVVCGFREGHTTETASEN